MKQIPVNILKSTLRAMMSLRGRARPYARASRILTVAFLAFFSAASLRADFNPGNDSANLEISIIPHFDRGVEIDTATVQLNLGAVEMGASTQTVRPATVTIIGNVLNNELNLSANIVGGWTFDDDVTSTDTDKLANWIVFKSATDPAMPAKGGANFDDANDSLQSATPNFGPVRVGTQGGNSGLNGRFEDGVTDMDSLVPQDKRHIWFYFRTPGATSFTNQQEIHYTLTVTPGP